MPSKLHYKKLVMWKTDHCLKGMSHKKETTKQPESKF